MMDEIKEEKPVIVEVKKHKKPLSEKVKIMTSIGLLLIFLAVAYFIIGDIKSNEGCSYDCVDYCSNWCSMCVPREIPNNPMASGNSTIDNVPVRNAINNIEVLNATKGSDIVEILK